MHKALMMNKFVKSTVINDNSEDSKKPRQQLAKEQASIAKRLFNFLDADDRGHISKQRLLDALQYMGILTDDPRLQETLEHLAEYSNTDDIRLKEFVKIVRPSISVVENAVKGNFVVPQFTEFCQQIEEIYQQTLLNKEGKVADYIAQLARVNPDYYGLSVCTVDGQRFDLGDHGIAYSTQSTCKPINYCLALEEMGEEEVHRHIGKESSGREFNEITLNKEGLPHNPMLNSGGIMSCALIRPDLNMSDRFDYVMEKWGMLAGNKRPGFNNAIYLSERQSADRNFALGYFMQEKGAFPDNTNLVEVLEFYFQCCSIEVTAAQQAIVASTLANGGVCPLTGEKVFAPRTVKNCLSLMSSSGMYDYSGEFAFSIGLPAKSGVSGALMLVIPKVMGITIWSPRLDTLGNSVRGLEFCNKLVERFNFHAYDILLESSKKQDPRRKKHDVHLSGVMSLCWAASCGDMPEIIRLLASGVDVNAADYDGRTALHLAAAEGHIRVVRYFIAKKADLQVRDRWGNTPLEDAQRNNHIDVIELLEPSTAKKNKGDV